MESEAEVSTNPPSFRIGFESQIAGLPPEHQKVLRNLWNANTDVNQAIVALKSQVDAVKSTATATASAMAASTTNISETIIQNVNTIGQVNNQSGQVAYTTAQSDNGGFIILSDAAAIAITLSVSASVPGIVIPWFCIVLNLGVGAATLTPVSGTINGASSFVLEGNNAATVTFDGTNFYIEPASALPQSAPSVLHQWLKSFDSSTGLFSQTQPAFTDISGTATAAQVPALSALTGQITAAQLPPGGVSATITTAKLTVGGTNGSMTYVDGQLTAQTPAT